MNRTLTSKSGDSSRQSGTVLLAALIIVAILALTGGTLFLRSAAAYRGTYQASAWHEARMAADAGIDFGVSEIQKSLPATNTYAWPGWSWDNDSTAATDRDQIRRIIPSPDLLVQGGDGSNHPMISKVEIDVITRDGNISRNPWYRIRSTGSADLAPTQLGLDKRDLFLRRMSLQHHKIARTVEVVVRPVYLWEYALKTNGSMTLGGGSSWVIDSYDSRYDSRTSAHAGSTGGMYDATKARAFGNIASNLQRPVSTPYGVLIDAEGALVRGEVQTHGGDDPATDVHENVEEGQQIDQTRITSEFDETLLPAENPLSPGSPTQYRRMVEPWGSPNVSYASITDVPSSQGSVGTSPESPLRIKIDPPGNQSQGEIRVAAAPLGESRYVEIYVNGNLSLSGGGITVPPGVFVKLFVNGDLDFKNQDLNYTPATSSRVPGNLQIFGVSTNSAARVDSSGNGHIVGVFYGPQYAGNLDGNTEIMGGFVLKSYNIAGGGGSGGDSVGAGFHYDEALGVVGPIQAYKVVNYFEDSRKDLE